jgi:hypothetical protein
VPCEERVVTKYRERNEGWHCYLNLKQGQAYVRLLRGQMLPPDQVKQVDSSGSTGIWAIEVSQSVTIPLQCFHPNRISRAHPDTFVLGVDISRCQNPQSLSPIYYKNSRQELHGLYALPKVESVCSSSHVSSFTNCDRGQAN